VNGLEYLHVANYGSRKRLHFYFSKVLNCVVPNNVVEGTFGDVSSNVTEEVANIWVGTALLGCSNRPGIKID